MNSTIYLCPLKLSCTSAPINFCHCHWLAEFGLYIAAEPQIGNFKTSLSGSVLECQ